MIVVRVEGFEPEMETAENVEAILRDWFSEHYYCAYADRIKVEAVSTDSREGER